MQKEQFMSPFTAFCSSQKWPPIKIECPNPAYANEMLSNIGSCNSELSAVNLYLYNNIILTDTNRQFAEIFRKIAIVEMHHWQIFAQLARMLGADPRPWSISCGSPVYWSPDCLTYPQQTKCLLENSLKGEQDAIAKYERQACSIRDSCVTALLSRIILDEKIHVEIFREMLEQI